MVLSAVRAVFITAAISVLAGCANSGSGNRSFMAASFEARSGSSVVGSVRVSRNGRQIRLRATVSGLEPGSEHGFHIHEKGDCSAADASSAGAHFNPTGSAHGRYGAVPHHAGDLPSLIANRQGVARVDALLNGMDWDGGRGIKGRAIIVHAKPDDFTSQPAGNAGARVACAAIG